MRLPLLIFLSWLLPLIGCTLIGTMVFSVAERFLSRPRTIEARSIGRWAFMAGAALFGLRVLHLLFVVLGQLQVSFRASVLIAGLLATASPFVLRRLNRNNAAEQAGEATLLRIVRPRRKIAIVHGLLAVAFAALAIATLSSPPSAWDLYTHWLIVPHEILNKNHMAYAYGATRTVAPGYPTHQVLLGAIAMLPGKGLDALNNGFPAIFLFFAMVAVAEAAWLLTSSRWLTLAAGLFPFALAGTEQVVFGFFYGDALVITAIAFACLGLVYRVRNRERATPSIVWIFVTMPIISKGIGGHVAAMFVGILLLYEIFCAFRKRPSPWRRPLRGMGVAAVFVLLEIGVPWLCNHRVVSNFTDPIFVTAGAGSISLLGRIWHAFINAAFFPLQATTIVGIAAPVLGALRYRTWRRTHQREIGAMLGLATVGTGLMLATISVLVPAATLSFPRYTTMLGPLLALSGCAALASFGTAKKWIGLPMAGLSIYLLISGQIPGYIQAYSPLALPAKQQLPKQHEEYLVNRALYDQVKTRVDSVKGRVILIVPDKDIFIPFRINLYFAIRNIKAKLLSEVDTSVVAERGIAGKVRHWLMVDRMRTPRPVEVNPETDFLLFAKPTVVEDKTYTGVVAIRDLPRR